MIDPLDPIPVALRVAEVLDGLHIQYAVGGSIASGLFAALPYQPRSVFGTPNMMALVAGGAAALLSFGIVLVFGRPARRG